jgi:hypothetical protein
MPSPGMLYVTPVRTDVSEELSAYIIRVTRIVELGTTLMLEALSSSETSVHTGANLRNIPEYGILLCCYFNIFNKFYCVGTLQHFQWSN